MCFLVTAGRSGEREKKISSHAVELARGEAGHSLGLSEGAVFPVFTKRISFNPGK